MKYKEISEIFELRDGELWRKGYIRSDGKKCSECLVKNIANQSNGYCRVGFKGKMVLYHRIVYALHNKTNIPKELQIDHIDGNKLNNSPENLRLVTNRENQQNQRNHREGRLVGTTFHKRRSKWQARIKVNGKKYSLGYYNTELEAHQVYLLSIAELED